MSKSVKLSLRELKGLIERLDNNCQYNDCLDCVKISIKNYPNDRPYVEFEQPSIYVECNSLNYRYDSK